MKDERTRRDFLKAAGLALGAIAGVAATSRSSFTQEQDEKKRPKPKPKPKPKEEEPDGDDLFDEESSEEEETRACPQCGALMYRQGRTWTCETCGYSYVE